MPTIGSLLTAGHLDVIGIPLDGGRQPWRTLYGTRQFFTWLNKLIAEDPPSPLGLEASQVEQIDALFEAFVDGRPLHHDRDFHVMQPNDRAIWELKTPDLRIFGWFLQRDHFACVIGGLADVAKGTGEFAGFEPMYRHFRHAAASERERLGCNPDPCLFEVEPYNVISVRHRI